jgi:hypothetical protein
MMVERMPDYIGKDPSEFDFQDIIYEKKDWVARVTINRPKVYNAYSLLALQEMGKAFWDATIDDEVAVIVLTGAGEKAFCTGGDVKEYAENYTVYPRDFWKEARPSSCPSWWATAGPARSCSCARTSRPRRPWSGDWSTRWSRWPSWTRPWSGCPRS